MEKLVKLELLGDINLIDSYILDTYDIQNQNFARELRKKAYDLKNKLKKTPTNIHLTSDRTGIELLNEGINIQKTDIDILRESNKLLETTSQISLNTLERLYDQRKQLHRTKKDLEINDDNLNRADKSLKLLGRRIY